MIYENITNQAPEEPKTIKRAEGEGEGTGKEGAEGTPKE